MHGLIFVTWEKYLTARFGSSFLQQYRDTIGETPATAPLADRVYEDKLLLTGVDAVHKSTGLSVDILLREYGRYFLINELTSHRCVYLLSSAHSGQELLLTMRRAHAQMRRVPDGLTPPLFEYEAVSPYSNKLIIVYENHRQLCPLLWGAIEGAAERYNEKAHIVEQTCMRRGYPSCRFEVTFSSNAKEKQPQNPELAARYAAKRQLADLVLSVLPATQGINLTELQGVMATIPYIGTNPNQLRPTTLLEALHHLQHAGLVASTANQPGDDLMKRRYWRAPTTG